MEQNVGLPPDVQQAKSLIRRQILSKRLALSLSQVQEFSSAIQERLLGLKAYAEANIIMCYMPCRREVDTEAFIRHALESGKRVCLPVVVRDKKHMLACQVDYPLDKLSPDTYGILSPCYSSAGEVNPGDIQLILVPGIAFDERGYRLGYGGGYYDRFLSRSHAAVTVGLAYEFQLLDELPVASHDVKLDLIVTQQRVIYC